MTDMLKTVNKIVSQGIPKVQKGTMKGYYIRKVVDVNGMYAIVESGNSPIEPPSNRYGAWLGKPNLSDGYKRLLKQGVELEAKVKLIDNKWEVLAIKIKENEPEDTEDWGDPSEDY